MIRLKANDRSMYFEPKARAIHRHTRTDLPVFPAVRLAKLIWCWSAVGLIRDPLNRADV